VEDVTGITQTRKEVESNELIRGRGGQEATIVKERRLS
jgi:hypothetical protein